METKGELRNTRLLWHWLAIVYVWSIDGDVDDETAFVALSRIKQYVDAALGVIEGDAQE